MKAFIGGILFLILFLFIILVVIGIAVGVISGLAVGIGWLLTFIYPFTLFESTLIGILSMILAFYLLRPIFENFFIGPFDEAEDEENNYKRISPSRFFKSDRERTWVAWLNYEFANDIYIEFQDNPNPVSNLSDMQTKELAVRLAEIATAQLRGKTKRAVRLDTSINFNIEYYYDELLEVIRDKKWDDVAPEVVES